MEKSTKELKEELLLKLETLQSSGSLDEFMEFSSLIVNKLQEKNLIKESMKIASDYSNASSADQRKLATEFFKLLK